MKLSDGINKSQTDESLPTLLCPLAWTCCAGHFYPLRKVQVWMEEFKANTTSDKESNTTRGLEQHAPTAGSTWGLPGKDSWWKAEYSGVNRIGVSSGTANKKKARRKGTDFLFDEAQKLDGGTDCVNMSIVNAMRVVFERLHVSVAEDVLHSRRRALQAYRMGRESSMATLKTMAGIQIGA